jgi:hypothetical protein
MAISEELQVLITANTAEVTQRLDQLINRLEDTGKKGEQAGNGMSRGMATAKAAIEKAAYASVAFVAGSAYLIKASMTSTDEMAKLARAVGGTTAGMQVLSRAASRAGVDQNELQAAATRLNQTLGNAISKGGESAEMFKRLGLNAAELANMDVDQRFSAIATALKEQGLTTQEASAALREMGIRQSSIITLMQEGADAIGDSRKAIDKYGIALSEVDVAKVEAANDAFDEIGIVFNGVIAQLGVKFAPLLEAVSNLFLQAGIDAGGFGNIAAKVFDYAVKGVVFFANVLDATQRVIQGIGAVLRVALFGTLELVASGIRNFYQLVDKVPGIDMSLPIKSVKEFEDNLSGVVKGAVQELADITTAPLAGTKMEQFIKDAEITAEAAAVAAVNARDRVLATDKEGTDDAKAREEAEAAAKKAREKAEAEAAALREKNLDYIQQIRERLMSEQELEESQYAERRKRIEEMDDGLFTYENEKNQMLLELEAEHYDRIAAIQEKALTDEQRRHREYQKRGLAGHASYLQSIIGQADQHSKTLFNIKKVASLAEAALLLPKTVMDAYAYGTSIGGPPIGAAMAGVAFAAQIANMRAIAASSFGAGATAPAAAGSAGATQQTGGAQASAAAAGPTRYTTIALTGDVFSRGQVRGLLEQLIEEREDGAGRDVYRVV